jgi:DNA-binding winged helix-turn-helix (wHTH) protein
MDLESASTVAIRFGPFQLDPRAGYLRKGKTRLHLPPQPFKLLSPALG